MLLSPNASHGLPTPAPGGANPVGGVAPPAGSSHPSHPTRRPEDHATGQPNPAKADQALLRDIGAAAPCGPEGAQTFEDGPVPEGVPGLVRDPAPDPTPDPKVEDAPAVAKVKLTRKVRRGIALMRSLMLEAVKNPAFNILNATSNWPKYLQDDFNQAMAWIEQNEESTR